jgi:RNA polymerase sigma-70 factor (ECF subfamily)
MTEVAAEIETHRSYLYRYALLHVRDADRAQDVVQETLLAALENAGGYAGRSTVKTWLTGILKHKITDLYRKQARETPAAAVPADEDAEDFADQFFDRARQDHWISPPTAWADPERSLEQKRFWAEFETCTARMPQQVARAFAMREFMGMETEEICKALGISPTNCWVILYRARMTLRECLQKSWFGREEKSVAAQPSVPKCRE